ncbi:MAG: hypothetical protein KF893_22730 [Caldilineaceae bacterium]|nr:hypothetical protein [Caldilineaceae bacterium]
MPNKAIEDWSIWYPEAASNGVWMGRGRIDPTDRLLVHAAPPVLTVEVHDGNGHRIAFGQDLEATEESPICLLQKEGVALTRRDLWPGDEHIGLPVLLPGSEVGILQSWWNAEDQKEWRWAVEFYNRLEE